MDQEPFVDDIETYAQDIVDTVREPLLMLDTNLRVQSANRAFYETFHVSAIETENQLIYQLGNGQWDIPALRTLLEEVPERRRAEADFRAIETYAQDIVDTVREPLLILDTTMRVQSGNRAFYHTFMVSPSETENRLIYELGNGQWDIP